MGPGLISCAATDRNNRFGKDRKRLKKQGKNFAKLKAVIVKLANGETLEPKYKDHPLSGDWASFRDCHIEPDWVLIYKTDQTTLTLVRMGSHSDLFG